MVSEFEWVIESDLLGDVGLVSLSRRQALGARSVSWMS